MNKERLEKLRLEDERQLESLFDQVFNMKLLKELIEAHFNQSQDSLRYSEIKQHCLPLTKGFYQELDQLCTKIRNNLELAENELEFYLISDPSVNCQCLKRLKSSDPDIVLINSGLTERMPQDELCFVLGHEIGHLYFDHSSITRVFRIVYPDPQNLPPVLNRLYIYWSNISELSADRVGLLACKNFETALKAFLLLASGIKSDNFNLPTVKTISLFDKVLEELEQYGTIAAVGHPPITIRIKALEAFSKSKLWGSFESAQETKPDIELEDQISELTSILKRKPFNQEEYIELVFLAAAGIILMTTDKEVDEREYTYLLNILSNKIFWPIGFLEDIKKEDLLKLLSDSAKFISQNVPWKIQDLLINLFDLIMRDQRIRDEEVLVYKKIASECFGLSEDQVNSLMLEGIRASFIPFK